MELGLQRIESGPAALTDSLFKKKGEQIQHFEEVKSEAGGSFWKVCTPIFCNIQGGIISILLYPSIKLPCWVQVAGSQTPARLTNAG